MAVVWKEALCLGEYRDRYGRRLKFDRRYLRDFHANTTRLLSRGVPVPCVWEHQPVDIASPADVRAAYAKHTFGHLVGVRFNARGNVDLGLEVPDPTDRGQLVKTRFVSPKILDGFRDPKGGRYVGPVVGHLAATPTPVQFGQQPFQLSRGQTLYLSFDAEGSTVADDKKPDGDKKGGEGGGADGDLKELIAALKEHGFPISDKVSTLRELTIAVESCDKGPGAEGGAKPDEDEDYDLDNTETTPAPGGGMPTLMSDDRAAPLVKQERKDLIRRVKALFNTGRIDRPTGERLMTQLRVVELSFTPDAELVPNKLVTKIETLERLKEHTAWKPNGNPPAGSTQLSDGRTEPVARPQLGGKADLKAAEQAEKEATDFLLQFIPGGPPPKATAPQPAA